MAHSGNATPKPSYEGFNQYHIHNRSSSHVQRADNNEPNVQLVRAEAITHQCSEIARRSGLSDADLFYLNFDKVQAPLVSLDMLTEWVDSGCLGTFFSTEYIGSSDVSGREFELKSKLASLKGSNLKGSQTPGSFDMTPIPPPPFPTVVLSDASPPSPSDEHFDPNFGKHWSTIQTEPILHPSDYDDGVPDAISIPDDLQALAEKNGDFKVTPPGQHCPEGDNTYNKCCAIEATEHYWGLNVRNPLLAITTGVTSRGVKKAHQHVNKLALFTRLLPSLTRTYDCDVDYLLVIAFDKGDEFYDTKAGQDEMNAWLVENMAKPMALAGVDINFLYVEVDNVLKKPGPVFNAMLKEAYKAGADYFYRLNDDTELKGGRGDITTAWPKAFIGALNSLQPPYGVAGPSHQTGNMKILTHDFLNRVHMDIFKGVYYDPIYTDWWMDDYISRLYGKDRTIKSNHYGVLHHTSHHGGRRYEVGENKSSKLPGSIQRGREEIAKWMKDHGHSEADIDAFKSSGQGQPYKDFPCGDFTGIKC